MVQLVAIDSLTIEQVFSTSYWKPKIVLTYHRCCLDKKVQEDGKVLGKITPCIGAIGSEVPTRIGHRFL
jgi:hypothetical protein